MSNIDDTLLSKLVLAEHDSLRDVTGQTADMSTVPTYTPVAFAANGSID